MCYSAESSLISFTIGSLGSIYLLNSKEPMLKHAGMFLFAVALIQLLEYMMWIDQDCGKLNAFASKMVCPVLILQILTIFLGGYLFKTTIINDKILIVFIAFSLYYMLYSIYASFTNNSILWCSKPNENGALQWPHYQNVTISETYMYCLIFLIAPFFIKKKIYGFVLLISGLITYIFTRYENVNSSNSRWCFFSAFIPLILILVKNMT